MITFDKPINLNGTELRKELNNANVKINDETNSIDVEGNFINLDIANADKEKAALIIAAHNGTIVVPDNSAAKAALLAKMGLTPDEAKLLLS